MQRWTQNCKIYLQKLFSFAGILHSILALTTEHYSTRPSWKEGQSHWSSNLDANHAAWWSLILTWIPPCTPGRGIPEHSDPLTQQAQARWHLPHYTVSLNWNLQEFVSGIQLIKVGSDSHLNHLLSLFLWLQKGSLGKISVARPSGALTTFAFLTELPLILLPFFYFVLFSSCKYWLGLLTAALSFQLPARLKNQRETVR